MSIYISTTVENTTSHTDPDRVLLLALATLEVVLQVLQGWEVYPRA